MPSPSVRPRRSALYMPGANPRALDKARGLAADTLILDLEDAVAPEAKTEARAAVAAALAEGGYAPREVIVRINGLETDWGMDDLAMAVVAAGGALDGVLAPKVGSARDIERLERALNGLDAPKSLAVWVMIETPAAILSLKDIAAMAGQSRLCAFVMGTNDLAKDMHLLPTPDRMAFLTFLSLSVAAARSAGIAVIDGVYNDIQNTEGFMAECRQGRVLGFDGKTLIHPAQLAPANQAFSPDPADIAQAEAVIAAFADPAHAGKGVLKVNGRMTERLHLAEAQRLVAMAQMIASFETGI